MEFVVKNDYPTEITVGRFVVDGWMFEDHYTPGMYAPKRDYRVFDLHTGEPVSLATYKRIPPKNSYGLRVEVLDDAEGPRWISSKTRYWLQLANQYSVEFRSDVGKYRKIVRFPPSEQAWPRLSDVHHWSDLLPPAEPSSVGAPMPQGVRYSDYRPPWRWRLGNWYAHMQSWLLYGKDYHEAGDASRLTTMTAVLRNTLRPGARRGGRDRTGETR